MNKLFVTHRVNSFEKEEKPKIVTFTIKKDKEKEDIYSLNLSYNINK